MGRPPATLRKIVGNLGSSETASFAILYLTPRDGRKFGTTVMPRLIERPTTIESAGNLPKRIDEFIGRVNSGDAELSLAHMRSPAGWVEPGQTPEFREFTYVLRGLLRVETAGGGVIEVRAGQAIVTEPGEWVRYGTPGPEGAEYIAVCLPAFSPDSVHRDPE
jgi:quercetin dioxygenase-like cupin family protein